jgi:hypothetical protein
MKALTVWEPWASLIIIGAKPFEFRKWPAPASIVGERIVIHSSKREMRRDEVRDLLDRLDDPDGGHALKPEVARPFLEDLARGRQLLEGYGLGTVVLGAPKRAIEVFSTIGDSDRVDHNVFAWPMLDVKPFESPVLARGAQGFWIWEHRTCNAIGMHMPPPPETMKA